MSTVAEDNEIYALDLDWDLINHLVLPESLVTLKSEAFSADLIEDQYVRKVYAWQLDHVREHGQPASPSVLENEFEDITISEPLSAIGDLVDRLRDRYAKNAGRKAIRTVATTYDGDPRAVAHDMIRVGRELAHMTDMRGEIFGTGDYDRFIYEYDQRVLRGKGPSLGFEEIDDHFYGMLGLTFFLGVPKSYKSWFAINSMVENIINGKRCVHYSLELPAKESDARLRCLTAGIPYWKYLKGALMKDERKQLSEASEMLDGLGTYHIMKPKPGQRGIEYMIGNALDAGADAVYIDQLQYVEDDQGHMIGEKNETGVYWNVLARARDLSDDIPICFVHQFNRSAQFSDEMPPMQAAKGSAAVEETGTTVLGLWANKDMRASNVVEFGTLASRNYGLPSWTIGVDLSKGCSFDMLGQSE